MVEKVSVKEGEEGRGRQVQGGEEVASGGGGMDMRRKEIKRVRV